MRKSSKFAAFLIVILAASFFFPFVHAATVLSDGFESTPFDTYWNDNLDSPWVRGQAASGEAAHSPHGGTYDAWTADGTTEGYFISDDLNLSGASSASVSFYYYLDDNEAADLTLYYYDGTTYDTIAQIGGGTESTWLSYTTASLDSQYFISNFRIRFYSVLGTGENCFVDDVLVTKTSGTSVVLTESVTPSESLSKRITIGKSLSESVTPTDALVTQKNLYRSLTETVTVTESLTTVKTTGVALIADLSAEVAISSGLYETKTITRSFTETTVSSDVLDDLKAIRVYLSEVVALTSSRVWGKGVYWIKVETAIAITDTLATQKNLYRVFTEAVAVLDQLTATKGIGVAIVEVLAESLGVNVDLSTMKAIRWVATGTTLVSEVTDITKHILNTFVEFMEAVNVDAVLRAYSPLFPVELPDELTGEIGLAVGLIASLVIGVCMAVVFYARRRGDEDDTGESWQIF